MSRQARSAAPVLAVAALLSFATLARAEEPEEHPAGEHAAAEAGEHEGAAHHGGGHEEGFDGKTFVFQLVNFGILAFLLVKFGGGAISKQMRTRHDELKAALEEASRLRAEAEARLKQQEARLASLEHEIAAVRAAIRKEAEDEKARLIAAAEERARRTQQETAFLLDQQVKEAQLRLRREGAEAALKVADALLRKNVGPSDQAAMAKAFVADVEAGGPRSTP